jgi:uncharacterized protein (DUF3820 family)
MTRVLGVDDLMPLGKYKGHTVQEVIEEDPEYLVWAEEESSMDFDEEVLQQVQ